MTLNAFRDIILLELGIRMSDDGLRNLEKSLGVTLIDPEYVYTTTVAVRSPKKLTPTQKVKIYKDLARFFNDVNNGHDDIVRGEYAPAYNLVYSVGPLFTLRETK